MDVIRMETMRLSITKLMLENACFLMQRDSMVAWPLICDPTSRVLDWLRNFYGHTGLVEVKYSVSHPCNLKPPDRSLVLKLASIIWLLCHEHCFCRLYAYIVIMGKSESF